MYTGTELEPKWAAPRQGRRFLLKSQVGCFVLSFKAAIGVRVAAVNQRLLEAPPGNPSYGPSECYRECGDEESRPVVEMRSRTKEDPMAHPENGKVDEVNTIGNTAPLTQKLPSRNTGEQASFIEQTDQEDRCI